MSRSAAAGSHAAGPPGMHPEGVLAVVCLDNPRDNVSSFLRAGPGPIDLYRQSLMMQLI